LSITKFGIGSGLRLAYDIIKARGEEMKVTTRKGKECGCIVKLSK